MKTFLAIVSLSYSIVSPSFGFSPLLRAGLSVTARSRHPRQRPLIVASASQIGKTNGKMPKHTLDVPYTEAAYDPVAADSFFRERPFVLLSRFAQLMQLSGGFTFDVILDKILKREDKIVEERSQQLLKLVTKLGPTFVKVGQLLSIRTDLLPAPYVAGLVQLQDAVPPFPGEEGRAIIEAELGVSLEDVFSAISLDPVASASIGQVYRATLRSSGEDVAIKVQRPSVLYNIALDLFLMREVLVPIYKMINNDNGTDLVSLVDAWGTGFVNELDYKKEAVATTAFSEAMEQRGLGSVTAPGVLSNLSSVRVLTTKWVDGEKLAASSADDVPRLCGVALNAYLTMLLDTGLLHCDPHPGNLLRTHDGKLCILDFGMCLEVPQDLQLSLLEFIANLQAQNYESIPDDLVKLGFVPEDKIDELRTSGLTFGIAQMLRVAAAGGGPKGAMDRLVSENKAKYRAADGSELPTKERQRRFREDWQKEMANDALSRSGAKSTTADLTQKVEELQQQNSNVFKIPEYFIYMSRAFATLEGIGLSSDSNYAILQECFPYLAKRLLSDDSPRARGALRTLLYGTGSELNLAKLQEITTGLESYTSSTSSVDSSRGVGDVGRNVAAEQLAAVLLSENDNFIQSLLLREAAVAFDASLRDSLSSSIAPLRQLLSPPRPTAPLFAPLSLPFDLVQAAIELNNVDSRDAQRLANVEILADLARRTRGGADGNVDANRAGDLGMLAREVAARRNALARIGVRFSSTLAATQAERLRQRGSDDGVKLSTLAGRLAEGGADRLDDVAEAIASLDRIIETRTDNAVNIQPAKQLSEQSFVNDGLLERKRRLRG